MDILNSDINLNGDAIPIIFSDLKQIIGGRSNGVTTTKGIYDAINGLSSKNFINNIVSGCIITNTTTSKELDPSIKYFSTTYNINISSGFITINGELYYYNGDTNINPRKSWKFVPDEISDNGGNRISKNGSTINDVWIKKYAKLIEGTTSDNSWLIRYTNTSVPNSTIFYFYINTPFISKFTNINNTSPNIINYDELLLISKKGGRQTPLSISDTKVLLTVDNSEYHPTVSQCTESLFQITCNSNDVASCIDLKVPLPTASCDSDNNNFINLKTASGIIGRIYAINNGFGIYKPGAATIEFNQGDGIKFKDIAGNNIESSLRFVNTPSAPDSVTHQIISSHGMTLQSVGNMDITAPNINLKGKIFGYYLGSPYQLFKGSGSGGVQAYLSDSSLKSNISELPYNIETITKLSPVLHNWNETYIEKYIKSTGIVLLDNASEEEKESYYSQIEKYREECDKQEIGLIAQDVQKIIPEVVGKDSDGYLTINYPKLVPVLINGIKEQQDMILKQQEIIEKQQAQLDSILKRLEKLEQ